MSKLNETPYLAWADSNAKGVVTYLRTAHSLAAEDGDHFAQIAIMDALEAAVNLQRRVAQLLQAANGKH